MLKNTYVYLTIFTFADEKNELDSFKYKEIKILYFTLVTIAIYKYFFKV